MLNQKLLLLLAPDITPDGVVTGGGAPVSPSAHVPEVSTTEVETLAPEVIEDEEDTVSIDDFTKSVELKNEEPPKKESEDVVEDQPKGEATKKEDSIHPKQARDYSDIEEADRELFKNMNNKAFATLKPVYLEHKKLKQEKQELEGKLTEAQKGGLPPNYFEHPDAYIFDSEYKNAANLQTTASSLVSHWEKQLEAIEQGKEWQAVSLDEKTGNFVLSEPRPSDAHSRVSVMRMYNQAMQYENQYRQQTESIRNNFTVRSKEISKAIQQVEKDWFPEFADDKATLSILAKDIESKLPSFVQNSPLKNIVARSTTIILSQRKAIEQLQEQLKTAAVTPQNGKGAAPRKSQPNAGDMGAAVRQPGTNGADDDVTFDDFQKIIEGIE